MRAGSDSPPVGVALRSRSDTQPDADYATVVETIVSTRRLIDANRTRSGPTPTTR